MRRVSKLFTVDDETREVSYHDEITPIICISPGECEVIIADCEGQSMFKLIFDQNLDHEPDATGCEMRVLIWDPRLMSPDKWLGNDGDEPFFYKD